MEDYLYISNDPDENADNFNPNWASFRELTTDEERYRAIRMRWGNQEVPDPKIDLTYRHPGVWADAESKENCFNPPVNSQANCLPSVSAKKRKKRKGSKRRSRSCTKPYEQLLSNIHKKYEVEYSWLLYKQRLELMEIQQFQNLQTYLCSAFQNNMTMKENLERYQQQEVMCLLSNHHNELQNVIGQKKECIDACKRFMKEIREIFTFYQKINSNEKTLEMTDSQYEHSVETEKMYSLYGKFYN